MGGIGIFATRTVVVISRGIMDALMDVVAEWLSSLIRDAPYLFGAVVFMYSLWRELRACISATKDQNKAFLDYILRDRISGD